MSWASVALADVCEINIGRTPARAKKSYWAGGTHPWVSIADMSRTEQIHDTKERITDIGVVESGIRTVDPETVLMSFKLSIGKVAIAKVPLFTNEAIAALPIRDRSILDPSYLFRALQNLDFQDSGNRAVMGRTLNKQSVSKLEIPLPPLDEQRRIAAILDKADELRRKRKRAIELLDGLTQSIFLDMFGDPIENPRKLPTRRLIDLVDAARGISYGIVQRGDDQNVGVKVLRILDFQSGEVDGSDLKMTTPEIAGKYRRTILEGGELVISIRGTVGRCAEIPCELRGANVSREVAVMPTVNKALNDFYLALLRTDSAQRRLRQDVKGVAQSGINLEDLRELHIVQPSNEDIASFQRSQSRIADLKRSARLCLLQSEAVFSSLQHRAFSGQL